MLVEQLNGRIEEIINQLEHAMFLSNHQRGELKAELLGLVVQRDKAREAMRTAETTTRQPSRRFHGWPSDY